MTLAPFGSSLILVKTAAPVSKKQDTAILVALFTLVVALIAGALTLLFKALQGIAWCVKRLSRSEATVSPKISPHEPTLAEIMAAQRNGAVASTARTTSRPVERAPNPRLQGRHAAIAAVAQKLAQERMAVLAPSDTAIEPIVVQRAQPVLPSSPIPAAPATITPAWVGFDDHAALERWKLPRGGVYIGTPSNSGNDPWRTEPALVDPTLPIDASRLDYSGRAMGYWPSYRSIQRNERATYLAYLHSDRAKPDVGLGYVFLYFYGLERRLLVDACDDASARAEAPAILAEIDRLIATYGPISRSFQRYATDLRDLGQALYSDSNAPHKLTGTSNGQLSPGVVIEMGKALDTGEPVPAPLAFAWAAGSPTAPRWHEWRNIEIETRQLFAQYYKKTFGAGIQGAKTTGVLNLHHHGAASNRTSMTLSLNIADPRSIEPRLQQLPVILSAVVRELESLKALRTRRHDPLAEAVMLPAALRAQQLPPVLDGLQQFARTVVRDSAGIVALSDLRQQAGLPPADKIAKRDAVACAHALESIGFGLEPDVRCGGVMGKTAVLFALDGPAGPAQPGNYSAAVGVLHLAFAMANADSVVTTDEVQTSLGHVSSLFHLDRSDQLRLKARMQLLQLQPPSMTKLLGGARNLSTDQRKAVAELVIGIAHADGSIDPAEVKLLERIYRSLDLDPTNVHSDLHRYATQSTAAASASAQGLDTSLIAAKMKETEAVQKMLGRIFADADAASAPAVPVASVASDAAHMGLDSAHSALVEHLLTFSSAAVSRAQWELWCEPSGLMPDGAIETINDAAFDAFGEPLIADEGDMLEIQRRACDALRHDTRNEAHA